MRKDEYVEYLTSDAWQAKRQVALGIAQGRCQLCNSDQDLHVHHRTYDRVGEEEPGDLTVLCKKCHARFHRIPKQQQLKKPGKKKAKQVKHQAAKKRRKRLLDELRREPAAIEILVINTGMSKGQVAANLDVLRRQGKAVRPKNNGVWRLP